MFRTAAARPITVRVSEVLYAEKEPIKYERAALRWLARYVRDGKAVSLLGAALRPPKDVRAAVEETPAKVLCGGRSVGPWPTSQDS